MNDKLHKITRLRHFLFAQTSGLTAAQLNEIPRGYNNNIVWNLGHLSAAVQSLCYGRAGLPPTVGDDYFTPYLPGTRPAGLLDAAAIEQLKKVSLASLDQLRLDLAASRFASYSPSAWLLKLYGVEVHTIEDALEFLLYHEGFHAGYVLALKHLVQG